MNVERETFVSTNKNKSNDLKGGIAMRKIRFASRGRLVAMGLGLGAIVLLSGPPLSLAEDSSNFVEKMKKWQSEMSEKFRDTYKGLRGENQKRENSAATASVDLREQNESYTVRLSLPNRDLDRVEVKLEGDELRIVAPPRKRLAATSRRFG